MSVWISIEHAPKDRPVDLWLANGEIGIRVPNCKWGKYIDHANQSDANKKVGWCCYSELWDDWTVIETEAYKITHYMLIPEGPTDGR